MLIGALGIVPKGDGEESLIPDHRKQTARRRVRDFLRLKGAALGVAMIAAAVVAGVLFVYASGVRL